MVSGKRLPTEINTNLNANIELSAVSWMGVSGVVAWLVVFTVLRTNETFGYLQLVATLH